MLAFPLKNFIVIVKCFVQVFIIVVTNYMKYATLLLFITTWVTYTDRISTSTAVTHP